MTGFRRGIPTIHYTELEALINENFPSKAGEFKYIDRLIDQGGGVRNGTFIFELVNGFHPEELDEDDEDNGTAIKMRNLELYMEGREKEMRDWGENGTLGILLGALREHSLIDEDVTEILVEVWW